MNFSRFNGLYCPEHKRMPKKLVFMQPTLIDRTQLVDYVLAMTSEKEEEF